MVAYSDSFFQFLKKSECRVAQILYNAHKTGYRAYDLMITTEQVDYITFRNDGTISFLPAGKEHTYTEDGTWAREGRQNGRPAKVIQKLFTKKALKIFKPKDFECFSNAYKAEYNGDQFTFQLLPNKKIPRVYEMDRASGGGTLNESCMNDDSEYLDIYKYCEKLSILILTDKENKLCGRALVWKVAEGVTVMDRIYVASDFMYDMFLEYAKKEEWLRKRKYDTYDYKSEFVTPDGQHKNLRLRIETRTDFDSYPYIDTFAYGDDYSLNNYGEGCYEYTNTDGKRDGDSNDDDEEYDEHADETWDDIDSCYIDSSDAVEITAGSRRRDNTHRDNTETVRNRTYWRDDNDIVQIDDEYYHIDDTVYSEYDSTRYLKEDCVYSLHNGSWILEADAIEMEYGMVCHKNTPTDFVLPDVNDPNQIKIQFQEI